jgi:hypothetical protein
MDESVAANVTKPAPAAAKDVCGTGGGRPPPVTRWGGVTRVPYRDADEAPTRGGQPRESHLPIV